MLPLLYRDLVPWYWLVDPTADHADEAGSYQAAIERTASAPVRTLLELGSGAGNNAFFLKQRFDCTLTDLSEDMLALSRQLNPECEHVVGDMRSVRLDRQFDAVLVHDAVQYMTSEDDLRAVAMTAFAHTRSGGAAIFAPDSVRESFRESTVLIAGDDGPRSLRAVEWVWDPDPADSTILVEYMFLLRENGEVRTVHDRHLEGLFSAGTWKRILSQAGFTVGSFERPIDDENVDECFVCHRP